MIVWVILLAVLLIPLFRTAKTAERDMVYYNSVVEEIASGKSAPEGCTVLWVSDPNYKADLNTHLKNGSLVMDIVQDGTVTGKAVWSDADEIKAAMSECMAKRSSKQPLEYPSAGSTFKRPEGSYASLLIDQCGLKGLTCGGAMVSEKHSGFVINKGYATCADVLELCDKVKTIVKEKTGYQLELEPVILQ